MSAYLAQCNSLPSLLCSHHDWSIILIKLFPSHRMNRGGGRGGFDGGHFRNSGNGQGMSDAAFPGTSRDSTVKLFCVSLMNMTVDTLS